MPLDLLGPARLGCCSFLRKGPSVSLAARIQPDPALVLAKATLRAAQALRINHASLARILGTSAATVSRLARGRPLAPGSKEGELALLVVRAYRSLDAVVGGQLQTAAAWFAAENSVLGGRPVELVERAQGLVAVVRYLDAVRGRL